MTFLKQTAYSTYVLGKLSKFVQTSTLTSLDSFPFYDGFHKK